jgi:DNA polymerase III gamma/tau subunit
MTEQAQNALLKIFEEGPENTYFFLLAENSASLLSTVRSRAPEVKTEAFSSQRLEDLLVSNVKKAAELRSKDPLSFNRIINVAEGSYGKALESLESRSKKSASLHERAEELVEAMSKENGSELLMILIAECSDREKYLSLLRLVQTGVRDLCAVKRAEGQSLLLFASREKAAELSEKFSLKALVSLGKTFSELIYEVSGANVNLRTAAIAAYGRIRDCK